MSCLLDEETFICCLCNKEFSHVDGTWLPLEDQSREEIIEENVINLTNLLRKPEILTSENFTCYDCL